MTTQTSGSIAKGEKLRTPNAGLSQVSRRKSIVPAGSSTSWTSPSAITQTARDRMARMSRRPIQYTATSHGNSFT